MQSDKILAITPTWLDSTITAKAGISKNADIKAKYR